MIKITKFVHIVMAYGVFGGTLNVKEEASANGMSARDTLAQNRVSGFRCDSRFFPRNIFCWCIFCVLISIFSQTTFKSSLDHTRSRFSLVIVLLLPASFIKISSTCSELWHPQRGPRSVQAPSFVLWLLLASMPSNCALRIRYVHFQL